MTETPRQTVLIVDDDRINRTILAELLQDECRVLLAKDGVSALQRARQEEISLILLDVSMPKMNGYRVLQQLQSDDRTSRIAVIFITGLTDQEDEERGLLLGAVDYVIKPIRPAIVKARIKNHLKMVAQRKALEQLAGQDGLTGISNRRHCDESLALSCQIASRVEETISVAMIDVDFFKQYNDLYGHGAGDEVLRKVARVVSSFARRPYDIAARYGGEEFVLALLGMNQFDVVLEELRQNIFMLNIPHAASHITDRVSVSIGAVTTDHIGHYDPIELLQYADKLLYEAKRSGRNKVVSNVGVTPPYHSVLDQAQNDRKV